MFWGLAEGGYASADAYRRGPSGTWGHLGHASADASSGLVERTGAPRKTHPMGLGVAGPGALLAARSYSRCVQAKKRPDGASSTKPPPMKRRSGYYKVGARKGTGDTRMGKKVEEALRAEIATLQRRLEELQKRVGELETEVSVERNLRLSLEGEAAESVPRYRRALRDLQDMRASRVAFR